MGVSVAAGAAVAWAAEAAGGPGSGGGWLRQAAGWLVAGLAWVWAWVRRNRRQLLGAAAEAVAFAEKFRSGASNEELEVAAVEYVREYWPDLPEWAVRWAIREICRRRKARAVRLGYIGVGGVR